MAETKKPDSEESKKPAPISVGVDEELSDAELDNAIAEADPEFLKSISEIGNDKTLSVSQIIITDEDQALNLEKDAWANSGKLGKTLYRIFPGLPYVSMKIKRWKFALFAYLRATWIRIKNFLYFLATDGKNKLIGKVKAGIGLVTGSISEAFRQFSFLKWPLKLAVIGILALFVGTSLFIYKSLTKGVVPVRDELFIPSIERIASDVETYDPTTEVEPFFENLRAPTNIILMPKVVVNMRKSSQSGPNPMGAFEFFIEGMGPEVVIEIKDREVEVRDRMQRALEEVTFDQADSVEGKEFLCEKVKKEINLLLTTGKIKKIWIKTILIKP